MNVMKENSDLVASLNVYIICSTLSTCITQLRTGHANNKSCLVVAVDKLQALHGYKTANAKHIIQNNIDDNLQRYCKAEMGVTAYGKQAVSIITPMRAELLIIICGR